MDWIALLAAEGGAASGTSVPAFQDHDSQLAAARHQACTPQRCPIVLHAYLLAYGERLPHTEHHFLAEAVLDGPTAAVR